MKKPRKIKTTSRHKNISSCFSRYKDNILIFLLLFSVLSTIYFTNTNIDQWKYSSHHPVQIYIIINVIICLLVFIYIMISLIKESKKNKQNLNKIQKKAKNNNNNIFQVSRSSISRFIYPLLIFSLVFIPIIILAIKMISRIYLALIILIFIFTLLIVSMLFSIKKRSIKGFIGSMLALFLFYELLYWLLTRTLTNLDIDRDYMINSFSLLLLS